MVTALAAGSALTVAGCGGSASSVIDPVAQAATASTGTPGYRMNLSLSLSSSALPSPITATGVGFFDVRDHAGSVTLEMNLGNSPQVIQALGGSTLHIEELIKGLTIYMKLPAAITSKVPAFGAKPWVKIDIAKAASAAGLPGVSSLANNPASSDPSQFLQYLRAVSGKVSKVGTDNVNGVHTTHYRAEVSLDHVPDAVAPALRQSARQSISALEKMTNLRLLPTDVWVDGQHLVRRLQISFGENLSGGPTVTTSIRIDIPEYGPQPAPALPPADQVTDLTTLARTR
jgi:hypothetical protein